MLSDVATDPACLIARVSNKLETLVVVNDTPAGGGTVSSTPLQTSIIHTLHILSSNARAMHLIRQLKKY